MGEQVVQKGFNNIRQVMIPKMWEICKKKTRRA
uniref:Uncharacterized protein n=1 Tax=Rhizophora mucronata TaxID=61149 RepID=A0A2P2NS35_RHIMU